MGQEIRLETMPEPDDRLHICALWLDIMIHFLAGAPSPCGLGAAMDLQRAREKIGEELFERRRATSNGIVKDLSEHMRPAEPHP